MKKVGFVTWEIHLEWGVDDANPEVVTNRIDWEDFIEIWKLINKLPFYFEPSGKDIVQSWLYEEECLVLTYFGTIALDHLGSIIPFLFDQFEVTLEGTPNCELEFWLNSL